LADSLPLTVEPDSVTNPPSEFNSIAFMPYWVSFEQSNDSRHLNDTNHNLCGPTPSMLDVNAQVPEPSISSPTYTDQESPSYPPPFSSFTEQPIFGNTHPHGYPATQDLALFHEQDITNSIDFNPSPLSHSNIHALTAAHPIPSLRHASYDNTPSSTPSLAADSENISEHICMSTPTHSPTEHFDHVNVLSSYDLP